MAGVARVTELTFQGATLVAETPEVHWNVRSKMVGGYRSMAQFPW